MKTITEAEFTKTFEDVMGEVFELVVGQRAYLEVLWNETDYVGCLVEYEREACLYNATDVFNFDQTTRKYAYQTAVDEGHATETFYAYDSLEDAKAHVAQLLIDKL